MHGHVFPPLPQMGQPEILHPLLLCQAGSRLLQGDHDTPADHILILSLPQVFTSPSPLLQPLLTPPSPGSCPSSLDSFIDLTGQAEAFREPCLPSGTLPLGALQEQFTVHSPGAEESPPSLLGGGSVPHLARRRSSLARPTAPPRPPR